MASAAAKRFLFLYPGESRQARLRTLSTGETPREFFYGYLALAEAGFDCAIGDTRKEPEGMLGKLALNLEFARNRATNFGLSRQRVRALADAFRHCDVALSFTDSFSVSMGLLARDLAPNAFLAGGFHSLSETVDKAKPWARAYALAQMRRGLLGLDHLFFFGAADRDRSVEIFGLDRARTSVYPFGVDTDFWSPGGDAEDGSVVSVGSDPQRDYATLVAAPTTAPLRIVTRLPVPKRIAGDYELFRGSLHNQAISDRVLRDLYRGCSVVAVPLRETWQPSGYSVTLQAMACGKPVILSAIRGLWDPGILRSGENCVLVPPGDPAALAQAIDDLMADAGKRRRIGLAARETAERKFGLQRMNDAIVAMAERFGAA
ncbi:MAG: glycosyltransferase family 4 protein [Telmatospirillum sp.]|nr:glycosyltransferase family 4 protein [Telmatospirillum sp.]